MAEKLDLLLIGSVVVPLTLFILIAKFKLSSVQFLAVSANILRAILLLVLFKLIDEGQADAFDRKLLTD